MMPDGEPPYYRPVSVDWACPPALRERAAQIVERSLRSAPADVLAKELYRLRVLTRGRDARDPADYEAELVVWIDRLRCWPADVVVAALRDWPSGKDGEWWPTWHDLEQQLKRASARRIVLVMYLLTPVKTAEPEIKIDPEMRERVAAEIDKLQKEMAQRRVTDSPDSQTGGE